MKIKCSSNTTPPVPGEGSRPLSRAVPHMLDVNPDPTCARMQADGVPCESVDAACEVCAERYRRVPTS